MAGETHKITQATRKQPKHNPLLLNASYFTASEHSYIYYIRCGKRHTAERQWQNLFSPAPPLLSATHWILLIDRWPLTVDYWPLTIAHRPLTLDLWLLTIDRWPLTLDCWLLTVDHWPLTPWKKMKEICNRVFASYEESCTFARRLLSRRASKGLRLLVKRRQFYWPGTMSKKKARG